MPYHKKILIVFNMDNFINITKAGSPHVSTENLSRLSRAPSLQRNRQNRSGIPVAHRELSRGSLFFDVFKTIFCLIFIFLCVKSSYFEKLIVDSFLCLANAAAAANYRSISAVDANAAQRARARAQYANLSRLKMTPGSAAVRKYCK